MQVRGHITRYPQRDSNVLDSPLRRNPHAQFTLSRYLWKTEEYRDMLTRQHWISRFRTRAAKSYLNEVVQQGRPQAGQA